VFLLTFYTSVKPNENWVGSLLMLWTISSVGNCANDSLLLTLFVLIGFDSRLGGARGSKSTEICHTEFIYRKLCCFPGNFYVSCNISLKVHKWDYSSIIVFYIIIAIKLIVRGCYNLSGTSVLTKMYVIVKCTSWINRSFVFTYVGLLFFGKMASGMYCTVSVSKLSVKIIEQQHHYWCTDAVPITIYFLHYST
jgi:hypothetical protein